MAARTGLNRAQPHRLPAEPEQRPCQPGPWPPHGQSNNRTLSGERRTCQEQARAPNHGVLTSSAATQLVEPVAGRLRSGQAPRARSGAPAAAAAASRAPCAPATAASQPRLGACRALATQSPWASRRPPHARQLSPPPAPPADEGAAGDGVGRGAGGRAPAAAMAAPVVGLEAQRERGAGGEEADRLPSDMAAGQG